MLFSNTYPLPSNTLLCELTLMWRKQSHWLTPKKNLVCTQTKTERGRLACFFRVQTVALARVYKTNRPFLYELKQTAD